MAVAPLRGPGGLGRQCAALPIARASDGSRSIVLVTTRGRGVWTIPKGWVEYGVPASETAATEAREEAGLVGVVSGTPLGVYTYEKQLDGGRSIQCEVEVYEMQVTGRLETWREQAQRRIEEFPYGTVADVVHEPDLARLLRLVLQT